MSTHIAPIMNAFISALQPPEVQDDERRAMESSAMDFLNSKKE
jgi:hypothetical protein